MDVHARRDERPVGDSQRRRASALANFHQRVCLSAALHPVRAFASTILIAVLRSRTTATPMADPADPLEKIAHYRILERIGEGGMGTVYRALDEKLRREVAIKVLKKQDKPDAVQRFFREATAASALNHPNIVTVFEAGEADHVSFIAMELVRGQRLRWLIGQPMEIERFEHLARQMAEALSV